MIFIAGVKNTILYVAAVPHQDLSEADEKRLTELLNASGVKDVKRLTVDPRENLVDTVGAFPNAQNMFMLPAEQPLVWKCGSCGRIAPRWENDRPPVCCQTETIKDVNLIGLPWEH